MVEENENDTWRFFFRVSLKKLWCQSQIDESWVAQKFGEIVPFVIRQEEYINFTFLFYLISNPAFFFDVMAHSFLIEFFEAPSYLTSAATFIVQVSSYFIEQELSS